MTVTPFERALVRNSERALKSARLALNDGDYDNAVNRSCYFMFDITRAALLRAGVSEDKLPQTHKGVIEAFRQYAVKSGKIDGELAAELSRTESHRVKADCTGMEIDPEVAAEAVARAEIFVQTVWRVFDLEGLYREAGHENKYPDHGDKVSEPGHAVDRTEPSHPRQQPLSLEEERRQARENWLRLRRQNIEGARNIGHERDAARRANEEFSHSPGKDMDE